MNNIRLNDLIFIDIETVPQSPDYNSLSPQWQQLWTEKIAWQIQSGTEPEEVFEKRAGVMAEFSKVVCISMGYFYSSPEVKFRVKSFFGHEEKKLLQEFVDTLYNIEKKYAKWFFAGHNIKEFDIPFLCRRLLANGIQLPPFLDFQNMKPWETNLLDTFQYWRFGDYKNFTSLKLLAATLGVPSPKDELDGSMVSHTYWKENNIEAIVNYCQKDVVAVANIVLKFKDLPFLNDNDISIVTN